MLKSLFGDLGPREGAAQAAEASGFPSTTVVEDAVFNVHHHVAEAQGDSLFVTGSPAQAIRDHFRHQQAGGEAPSPMITLVDLSRSRAATLLRALAQASQTEVQRLQLREQATLRTLATVERVAVTRRDRPPLKLYHPDHHVGGNDEAEITAALAERSQLTAVLLAGASVEAAMAVLQGLQQAVHHSTWRCPALVFFVPADAQWLVNRVRSLPWPAQLQLEVYADELHTPNALWNGLLQAWERHATRPRTPAATPGPAEQALMGRVLAPLVHTEGLTGCALVDGATGTVLAGELLPDAEGTANLQRTAMACTLALRSHQHAARTMGLPPVEEISLTAGDHQHLIRVVAAHPGWFLVALLDRRRTNVTLARFKLMEAEKQVAPAGGAA